MHGKPQNCFPVKSASSSGAVLWLRKQTSSVFNEDLLVLGPKWPVKLLTYYMKSREPVSSLESGVLFGSTVAFSGVGIPFVPEP